MHLLQQDLNLSNVVTVKCSHRPKSYIDKQQLLNNLSLTLVEHLQNLLTSMLVRMKRFLISRLISLSSFNVLLMTYPRYLNCVTKLEVHPFIVKGGKCSVITLSFFFGLNIIHTVFLVLQEISNLIHQCSRILMSSCNACHDGANTTISSA